MQTGLGKMECVFSETHFLRTFAHLVFACAVRVLGHRRASLSPPPFVFLALCTSGVEEGLRV